MSCLFLFGDGGECEVEAEAVKHMSPTQQLFDFRRQPDRRFNHSRFHFKRRIQWQFDAAQRRLNFKHPQKAMPGSGKVMTSSSSESESEMELPTMASAALCENGDILESDSDCGELSDATVLSVSSCETLLSMPSESDKADDEAENEEEVHFYEARGYSSASMDEENSRIIARVNGTGGIARDLQHFGSANSSDEHMEATPIKCSLPMVTRTTPMSAVSLTLNPLAPIFIMPKKKHASKCKSKKKPSEESNAENNDIKSQCSSPGTSITPAPPTPMAIRMARELLQEKQLERKRIVEERKERKRQREKERRERDGVDVDDDVTDVDEVDISAEDEESEEPPKKLEKIPQCYVQTILYRKREASRQGFTALNKFVEEMRTCGWLQDLCRIEAERDFQRSVARNEPFASVREEIFRDMPLPPPPSMIF